MKREMIEKNIRILGQDRSQEGQTKPSTLINTVMTPHFLRKFTALD